MKNPLAGCAASLTGALVLLILVMGFVPDKGGLEVRQPLSETTTQAKGLTPVTRPLGHILWNVRGHVAQTPMSFVEKAPSEKVSASRQPVLEVKDGTVLLRTARGSAPVVMDSESSSLRPLFPGSSTVVEERVAGLQELSGAEQSVTDVSALLATAPWRSLGEPLDFQGLPLRWNAGMQACEVTPETRERTQKLLAALQELTQLPVSLKRRAERYRAPVERYAAKFKLKPALVYALIYTESSFNPDLISDRSAHGLMQVVPHTAGGEVHKWMGRSGLPEPEALLRPDTNIQYGTAYMHILLTKHLPAITNPESREYCAIAAYNIGTGGMLRTFGKTHEEAFVAINALSPAEVRDTLLKKLPARESRGFLTKVLASRERFAHLS